MQLAGFALLTDENILDDVVVFLRNAGFDVKDVKEENLRGSSDLALLQLAHGENRVVVTHDADFGKLVYTQAIDFTGILYLRPGHISAAFHISTLQTLLQTNPQIEAPFIVVAENTGSTVKIRIRKFSN